MTASQNKVSISPDGESFPLPEQADYAAEYAVYADIGISSIMPTPRLCRPMSATRPVWWGSLRWSRHNHRASKNASSVSLGRKRPGFVSIGVVLANARSLISRSACR